MDDTEFYRLVSFLRVSPYRQQIVQELDRRGRPATPSDLAESTGIHRNHVSTHLVNMRDLGVVTLLNPEASSHRYYQLTEKGQALIERAKEDDTIDWLES